MAAKAAVVRFDRGSNYWVAVPAGRFSWLRYALLVKPWGVGESPEQAAESLRRSIERRRHRSPRKVIISLQDDAA